MNYKNINLLLAGFFMAVLMAFSSVSLQAAEDESFNAGPFIIEHITDSYGWHICGDGDKSVTIPLPVMLIDNGHFVAFMSNKFHHGEAAYKGYAMGWGGRDGIINAYNRGLSLRLGLSRIFTFLPNNPNSGFMLKVSGGWMMQKTVFSQEYTSDPVPQLKGDYAKLYDHLRNGFIISEGIGFIYMSNYYTYVNIRVLFEVSQCVSWSTRSYQIDNLMGLNGKDHNRYFDLLYNIKLSWMFPLTGKTTYDYYYY